MNLINVDSSSNKKALYAAGELYNRRPMINLPQRNGNFIKQQGNSEQILIADSQQKRINSLHKQQDPRHLRGQRSLGLNDHIQLQLEGPLNILQPMKESSVTTDSAVLLSQPNERFTTCSTVNQSPPSVKDPTRIIRKKPKISSENQDLVHFVQDNSVKKQTELVVQEDINSKQQLEQLHKHPKPTLTNGNSYFKDSELQDFKILKKLGEGSFSTVYCVRREKDGKEYALKRIKIIKLNEKERENAINEVRFLASINCKNIIGYKQAIFDDGVGQLCVIMEYAEGGDLQKLIKDKVKAKENLDEDTIWSFAIQITQGIKVLHDLQILHRDLKSANVFLDKYHTRIMLGDLNVSKKLKTDGFLYTQTGTPYYASPEVWRDKPYNDKSDIWSLGCVIYEMCALRPPFKGKDMEELFKKVQKGQYDPIPRIYSLGLSQFISQLLRVNPIQRPSCNEILKLASVSRRMTEINNFSDLQASKVEKNELMSTIRVDKKLINLKDKLPCSRYEEIHSTGQLHQHPESLLLDTQLQHPRNKSSFHRQQQHSSSLIFSESNPSVKLLSQHSDIPSEIIPISQGQQNVNLALNFSPLKIKQQINTTKSPSVSHLIPSKSHQRELSTPSNYYNSNNGIVSSQIKSVNAKIINKNRGLSVDNQNIMLKHQQLRQILTDINEKEQIQEVDNNLKGQFNECSSDMIKESSVSVQAKDENNLQSNLILEKKGSQKQGQLQQAKILQSILNQRQLKNELMDQMPSRQDRNSRSVLRQRRISLHKQSPASNLTAKNILTQDSQIQSQSTKDYDNNNSTLIQNDGKSIQIPEKQSFVEQNQQPVLPNIFRGGLKIQYRKSELSLVHQIKNQLIPYESLINLQKNKDNQIDKYNNNNNESPNDKGTPNRKNIQCNSAARRLASVSNMARQ